MKTGSQPRNPSSRRQFFTRLAQGTGALAVAPVLTLTQPAWSLALPPGPDPLEIAEKLGGKGHGPVRLAAIRHARLQAARLVGRMTLKEKVGQLGNTAPAIPRLKLKAYQYWSEALHGLARGAPSVATSFPIPLAMANSWNPALAHQVYTAVSDEARAYHNAKGTPLAYYSPQTLNTAKDPRWGRIDETLGEDPYLISRMCAAVVRGMQGDNPDYFKTVCCAKHFICNETDDDRHVVSEKVNPRSFWEYYTRPFRAAVNAGVYTVMSAYNSINGIPCSADRFLLHRLLREHWGFAGYVTSDCDAVADIYQTHHYVPTGAQAAALAMQAGCDLNCGFSWGTYQKFLDAAIAQELVSEADIDRSLIRILSVRWLFGDFNPGKTNPWSHIPLSAVDSPQHRKLALTAARQTLTLLKNENQILPLNPKGLKKVLVVGPLANRCALGGYSGSPAVHISPAEGIAALLGAGLPHPGRVQATDLTGESWNYKARKFVRPDDSLGHMLAGDNAQLPAMNFAGKTHIRIQAASGGPGGTVEVRLFGPRGPVVAKIKVPNTGGWDQWREFSAPVKATTGRFPVTLLFRGQPGVHLMKLAWVELEPSTPSLTGKPGAPQVQTLLGCTVKGPAIEAWLKEAEEAARTADVVIAVVGADQTVAHEQHDRHQITLPGAQEILLQRLFAANSKTIAVLSTNSPLAVPWADAHLPAILCAYCAGQAQGQAIAEVLFGKVNPSGKLAETWFRGLEQVPDFHDFNIMNNRTYMYFSGQPLYPFGHGLSYTSFEYSHLHLSAPELKTGGFLHVSVTVKNTGARAGAEIAQFYVTAPKSKVKRPLRQLAGFARVELKPGEARRITFALPYHDPSLWYWEEKLRKFVLQPGKLAVAVGGSSAALPLQGAVKLGFNTDPHLGDPETLHHEFIPARVEAV